MLTPILSNTLHVSREHRLYGKFKVNKSQNEPFKTKENLKIKVKIKEEETFQIQIQNITIMHNLETRTKSISENWNTYLVLPLKIPRQIRDSERLTSKFGILRLQIHNPNAQLTVLPNERKIHSVNTEMKLLKDHEDGFPPKLEI